MRREGAEGEWGRGARLGYLSRDPRVPSYATVDHSRLEALPVSVAL